MWEYTEAPITNQAKHHADSAYSHAEVSGRCTNNAAAALANARTAFDAIGSAVVVVEDGFVGVDNLVVVVGDIVVEYF